MEHLLTLFAIPLIICLAGLLAFDLKIFRPLMAAAIWAQLALELFLFKDVLQCKSASITFVEGFTADRTGVLFALLTSLVVASALSHAIVFFKNEGGDNHKATRRNVGIFYSASAIFLIAMTLVCICDNLGFIWVCIETTTLASAPLVYYSRNKPALEATWKYLIICSVGIAFALLGTVLIFASSQQDMSGGTLQIGDLITRAKTLDYSLLRIGFIFCFLGYGTKAGVFPIHSWLPDAHSEAPAPASAMLSGGLLNCALLAIWRLVQIVHASGHPDLASKLPLLLGTLTVAAASFFLVKQYGIKRLWAYSSIENVGLMLTAIGLGSAPLFFLQALNHSLAKVSAFLISGNIIQACGTKKLHDIKGILRVCPHWAILLALAAFAVTGAPPFGAFISEWYLLSQSADAHMWIVLSVLVLSLAISFIAVCFYVSSCIWGSPPKEETKISSNFATSLIPAILIAASFLAGISPISQKIVRFL